LQAMTMTRDGKTARLTGAGAGEAATRVRRMGDEEGSSLCQIQLRDGQREVKCGADDALELAEVRQVGALRA